MKSKVGKRASLGSVLILVTMALMAALLYFSTTYGLYVTTYAAGLWGAYSSPSEATTGTEYVSLRPGIAQPGDRVSIVVAPFTLEGEPQEYSVVFNLNLDEYLPGYDLGKSLRRLARQDRNARRTGDILRTFIQNGAPSNTQLSPDSGPYTLRARMSESGSYYIRVLCKRYSAFCRGFSSYVEKKQEVTDPWRVVAEKVVVFSGREPKTTVDRPLTPAAVFEVVVPPGAKSGWVGLARRVDTRWGKEVEIFTNYRLCYLMVGAESNLKADLDRLEREWGR